MTNNKDENTFACELFNQDNVFKRFKVVEFPTSLVGLSTTQELDLEMSLSHSVYLKTMYEDSLVKFEDARNTSACHRAFDITEVKRRTIKITFKPVSECISKNKQHLKYFGNRFVFDLRLIKADGARCCNRERHAEIGRFYVSGQYEYCNIRHSPKTINFGDVLISTRTTKYVCIRNDSKVITAKMNYVKVTGFEVTPPKFTIQPNSSKRVLLSVRPVSLKMGNTLVFKIRNPHDAVDETATENNDNNFITYTVVTELNVIYNKKPKEVVIQSLHKLFEQNRWYTYLDDELKVKKNRDQVAFNFLQDSKSAHVTKTKTSISTTKEQCYTDSSSLKVKNYEADFCKKAREHVDAYDLFNVLCLPLSIYFGEIALNTYGEYDMVVKNNTKYPVRINLLEDVCIVYTREKITNLTIKLKPLTEIIVTILCYGSNIGNFEGSFNYAIDNKYYLKHPYTLQVSNPKLTIPEQNLKFGMVSSDNFVTSVPVRICNSFNIPVDFEWREIHPDTPFEIMPTTGSVPSHSCKICDISYICKSTKTKTHEVELISKGTIQKVILIELNVITRKLSIKFLQPAVVFKDIALNLETIENVKLENSSREIALFYVAEPLLPGVTVEPMSGILRPKMVLAFNVIVKISCVMEFAFDLCIKINNKESVTIPVSGNVIEPKITIQPKNIYMSRVPCNLITYVPVTLQNVGLLKAVIEVLNTGDENIFDVFMANGNEKQRVYEFIIEGGQAKTVFIKVCDVFRREYDMYIPFKINGLLGPPNFFEQLSTELQYYIGPYEEYYENNPKVKVKFVNKDITYCRIGGVITVPWIEFSVNTFEIEYVPGGENSIKFTMTNVSKYYLHVTINTSKLAPYFTMNIETENNQSIVNEANIKFELDRGSRVQVNLKFHPKGHGRFISVAPLYLDRYLTIPYYNLTFVGKRQTPLMTPSTHRIIFPPCRIGIQISRNITLKLERQSDIEPFTCSSKEEANLVVKFTECNVVQEEELCYTIVTVVIKVCCNTTYARNITLIFHHECGSSCDVEVIFCYTYCPLTLHSHKIMRPEDDPFPYFPLPTQTIVYEYFENCSNFLEKWMFQQGFRRDLYPEIPNTFHAISSSISSPITVKQAKGINVSYLNFIRRIAGPLMKHVKKISAHGVDESFKYIKEIHDTYKEIIILLKSRGANLWTLQAKFLLSYEQFVTYTEKVTSNCNADIILIQELVHDVHLFKRLNKQSWIDFILQSYKVFVMDSCFFDCVCVTSKPRDIIEVIIDWYNDQILAQQHTFREKNKPLKIITNITTDLSDGIAVISSFLNYCSFLKDHFSIFCEIDANDRKGSIINNSCLIIEAMNLLKMYFPLSSKDFVQPNFLQMLFLSIHLYVTLPMFKPRDTIQFNPPLLRSATRQLYIYPTSQESLSFTYTLLNNNGNTFTVEKAPSGENGKKMAVAVKYTSNFVTKYECLLLLHGYNKTRIFDTYILFNLIGHVGCLTPARKCKVTGPLYRPVKVDIAVTSPFSVAATFHVSQMDTEPTIPIRFKDSTKSRFYLQRLNLIDREIALSALPKEGGAEQPEHKLYFQLICLSTQIECTWVWFRSEAGDFFIKVTTQPRWDLALDTMQVGVKSWPMDPCSCGEACECYRTTVLTIPHRNELMIKSLRYALLENASEAMMQIFDTLIESTTGKIILRKLLTENGVNISEVAHILREDNSFRITSKALIPRLNKVTLYQHSDALLELPVTIPPRDKSEKYSVTLTSDCGMDIRTYRILFIPESNSMSTSFESL